MSYVYFSVNAMNKSSYKFAAMGPRYARFVYGITPNKPRHVKSSQSTLEICKSRNRWRRYRVPACPSSRPKSIEPLCQTAASRTWTGRFARPACTCSVREYTHGRRPRGARCGARCWRTWFSGPNLPTFYRPSVARRRTAWPSWSTFCRSYRPIPAPAERTTVGFRHRRVPKNGPAPPRQCPTLATFLANTCEQTVRTTVIFCAGSYWTSVLQ